MSNGKIYPFKNPIYNARIFWANPWNKVKIFSIALILVLFWLSVFTIDTRAAYRLLLIFIVIAALLIILAISIVISYKAKVWNYDNKSKFKGDL